MLWNLIAQQAGLIVSLALVGVLYADGRTFPRLSAVTAFAVLPAVGWFVLYGLVAAFNWAAVSLVAPAMMAVVLLWVPFAAAAITGMGILAVRRAIESRRN